MNYGQMAKQVETNYLDHKKIKGFEDVGYFLQNYVVQGGVVTRNVYRNNVIDVTKIVVVLDDDVQVRDATSFTTRIPNTTYYLDFLKGDFAFSTAHHGGNYLPVAAVATDGHGNVATITDTRGTVGGFRLKPGYPFDASGIANGSVTNEEFQYLNGVTGPIQTQIDGIKGLYFNVKDFGAQGNGGNDTVALQATINSAISHGSKYVFFPPGDYVATELVNLNDVYLSGDNATLTVNGEPYKITWIPKADISPLMYLRAIEEIANIPQNSLRHAQEAVRRGRLRMALIGDSITEGADQIDLRDTYSYRLVRLIKESLPNVEVVAQNFALGGRTFANFRDPDFVGIPGPEPYPPPPDGFYRPWSTIGKSWYDTVKDFEPDLLIVAFGMNDAYGNGADEFEAFNTLSLLNDSATWDVVPSIVVVPTMMSTKDHDRYALRQKNLLAVARATRMVGKNRGVATADANRLFQILRDGKEDVTRAAIKEQNFAGYAGTDWTGDKASFTLVGGVLTPVGSTGKFVTRNRQVYNGMVEVSIMPVNETDTLWINYREDSILGRLTVLVQPDDGIIGLYSSDSGSAIDFVTGQTIPAGEFSKIKVVFSDTQHDVYLNDTKVLSVQIYKKLHDGAISLGSNQTCVVMASLTMSYEDSIETEAAFTEDELLGKFDRSGSGNGINHPTGEGHALIYLPAFNGVIRALAETSVSYNTNFTNSKEDIVTGATVDLFALAVGTGSYPYFSLFVEISSFGVMQGVGARIVTSTYHVTFVNGSATWTQINEEATGTSGNQLSHTTTDGASPKISCVTVGSADDSILKSNIRIVGDSFAVTPL